MNTLIENNNIQYQVNRQLGQRIKILTNEMEKLIEDKQTNEPIIDEIDSLTTIINIETINKILEEIQEAITLSKVSVTSNKILSPREIHMIKNQEHTRRPRSKYQPAGRSYYIRDTQDSSQRRNTTLHTPCPGATKRGIKAYRTFLLE